jgi:small subunit ribosomal protein S9
MIEVKKDKNNQAQDSSVQQKAKVKNGFTGRYYYGLGRRKTAIAKVRVYPEGNGKYVANNEDFEKYFPTFTLREAALKPLKLVDMEKKVDISIKVTGGGLKGQVDAIKLGIARALVEYDSELRPQIKNEGYLTRDPRRKERKKYGLKRARRAPQWSKR